MPPAITFTGNNLLVTWPSGSTRGRTPLDAAPDAHFDVTSPTTDTTTTYVASESTSDHDVIEISTTGGAANDTHPAAATSTGGEAQTNPPLCVTCNTREANIDQRCAQCVVGDLTGLGAATKVKRTGTSEAGKGLYVVDEGGDEEDIVFANSAGVAYAPTSGSW